MVDMRYHAAVNVRAFTAPCLCHTGPCIQAAMAHGREGLGCHVMRPDAHLSRDLQGNSCTSQPCCQGGHIVFSFLPGKQMLAVGHQLLDWPSPADIAADCSVAVRIQSTHSA
jgi:hypothetical protein